MYCEKKNTIFPEHPVAHKLILKGREEVVQQWQLKVLRPEYSGSIPDLQVMLNSYIRVGNKGKYIAGI